jgi:hypothetical protein
VLSPRWVCRVVFLIEGEDRPTITISGVPEAKLDRTTLDVAMTGRVKVGGAMTRAPVVTTIVVIGRGNRRARGTVRATTSAGPSAKDRSDAPSALAYRQIHTNGATYPSRYEI